MDPARTSRDTWIGATILGPVGASIVASGLWGSPKCIKTLTLSADHH